MQGKDDIIELNGVHAPRVPMKVLILQERKKKGRGQEGGREGGKGRASMDYQYTSRMGTASHIPRPMCYWCMGTAGHVPRPMCYWWAWYY